MIRKIIILFILTMVTSAYADTIEELEFKKYVLNKFSEQVFSFTNSNIEENSNIALLDISGQSSVFSNDELKNNIISKIINTSSYNYIDKELISDSVKEADLGKSIYINPKEAIQLGRLHSIAYFVVIDMTSNKYEKSSDSSLHIDTLNYKIFNVEKGIMTYSNSFELKYENSVKKKRKALLRSLVVSGTGHFYLRKPLKGIVYTIIGNIPFIAGCYFSYQSEKNYDKYQQATVQTDIDNYFNEAQGNANMSSMMFSTATIIRLMESIGILRSQSVSLKRKELISIQPLFFYDQIAVKAQVTF
tara:strand:- start:80 stop:988 length:909 start_codon:yes stop_codon:yes gene_type:complete